MRIIGHQHALMLAIIDKLEPVTPPDIAVEWEMRQGNKISRGSLYPVLHVLESRRLIRGRKVRGGRTYPSPQRAFAITKSGRRQLERYREWTHAI